MNGNSFGGVQSVQILGLVSAMKTGDPKIDTIIAMILPIIFGYLLSTFKLHSKEIWRCLLSKSKLKGKVHSRIIVYRTTQSNNGVNIDLDEDSHNRHLIQGIKLYAHAHCNLKLDEAEIELCEGVPTKDNGKGDDNQPNNRNLFKALRRRNGNANISTASLLRCCQLVKKPIQQQWHDVGTYDGSVVQMWIRETFGSRDTQDKNPTSSSRNLEVRFESLGKDSIDQFVSTAFKWYTKEMKKLENNSRYLFDLQTFTGVAERKNPIYTSYRLGEDKTFKTLFSQQKNSLIRIMDDFKEKRGKFGIPGFPYKLGLLLHGPPGTGKTSLIKALANYTKRHIVNIPLARLRTNQELMAMFFNKTYNSAEGHSANLGFKQVIFVLEDVDATSDVVTRRKKPEKIKKRVQNDGSTQIKVDNQQQNALLENNDNSDMLSLSGILNVLDGVVDTPGRIVIMTTNFPDMLDPALIRPGRIDKILELGYMVTDDIISMLSHYFQKSLTQIERERIARVQGDTHSMLQITPAEMEQLVLEKDSIDSVIEGLESRALISSCSTTDEDYSSFEEE